MSDTFTFTEHDAKRIADACLHAATLLSQTADARHLCESQDADPNTLHSWAADAKRSAEAASLVLLDLRNLAIECYLGADTTTLWSTPNRLWCIRACVDVARARVGGTPTIDWGNAARLRDYADTIRRAATT